MKMDDNVCRLVEKIAAANYIVGFTGAGISTDSGIADFRGKEGVWRRINPAIFSVGMLRQNTEDFYRCFFQLIKEMEGKKPNDGHRALAELSRLGYLRSIVTQNIDGLHQIAGSQRVWEVHGHLRSCRCMGCRRGYDFSILYQKLQQGEWIPMSSCCGKLLRPDVVLFDDRPNQALTDCQKEAQGAGLILAVGTSLNVSPANMIPLLGKEFVLINREETAMDHQAAMVIRGEASEVMVDIVKGLGKIKNELMLWKK